ncbi:MAG: hypothetical protein QW587_04700 [Candidatus Bathyarchaeia archaeon]
MIALSEPDKGKLGSRGLLLSMLVEEFGSPGIVVDADLAARTGCRCYKVDETLLCFSKGIIGTLSKPQVEAYCPTKEILTEGGMVERVKRFREAAAAARQRIAGIPKGERLEPWLKAMGEELAKRGIEV